MDILKSLKNIPITVDILKRTRIGHVVNDARKKFTGNAEFQALGKELIQLWKKIYEESTATAVSSQTQPERSSETQSSAAEEKSMEVKEGKELSSDMSSEHDEISMNIRSYSQDRKNVI